MLDKESSDKLKELIQSTNPNFFANGYMIAQSLGYSDLEILKLRFEKDLVYQIVQHRKQWTRQRFLRFHNYK
jgi:hypothetical protein